MTDISIPHKNNAILKLRYMPIQTFTKGHYRASIAKALNVSRRLINKWVTKYLSNGYKVFQLNLELN